MEEQIMMPIMFVPHWGWALICMCLMSYRFIELPLISVLQPLVLDGTNDLLFLGPQIIHYWECLHREKSIHLFIKTCKTRPRGVWHLDQWYPAQPSVAPKGLHHGLKFWIHEFKTLFYSESTWYAPSPQLLYPPRPHIQGFCGFLLRTPFNVNFITCSGTLVVIPSFLKHSLYHLLFFVLV